MCNFRPSCINWESCVRQHSCHGFALWTYYTLSLLSLSLSVSTAIPRRFQPWHVSVSLRRPWCHVCPWPAEGQGSDVMKDAGSCRTEIIAGERPAVSDTTLPHWRSLKYPPRSAQGSARERELLTDSESGLRPMQAGQRDWLILGLFNAFFWCSAMPFPVVTVAQIFWNHTEVSWATLLAIPSPVQVPRATIFFLHYFIFFFEVHLWCFSWF